MEKVKKLEAELKGSGGNDRLRILNNLIISYMSTSLDKTINYCKEAIEVQADCTSIELRMDTFRIVARTYIERGENENAEKHLLTAIELAEEFGDPGQLMLVRTVWSEFFLRKSEFQKAFDVLHKSLDDIDLIKDRNMVGLFLNHLGITYNELGKYDHALDCYFRVLEKEGKKINRSVVCSTHINAGNIFTNCNEYEKALPHYNEALEIAQEIRAEDLICNCLLNIASINFSNGEFEKALDRNLEINQIYEESGFLADQQRVICNIGRMYSELGKSNLAIEYFEKALKISEELENKFLIAYSNRFLAEMHHKMKDFDREKELLLKALRIAEEIKSQELIREIYKELMKFYKSTRRYKKALEYSEKYSKLTTEIFNEESQKRIDELGVQYETQKKEREAELHRLKNVELAEANLKLKEALDHVKVLSGLIPICASCKKIRDDQGFWNQLEVYITQHSDASFTHGICPTCAEEFYGEFSSTK